MLLATLLLWCMLAVIGDGDTQGHGVYREWQSAGGQHRTEARLIDFNETHAWILKRNGVNLTQTPLARLRVSDRDYVEHQVSQVLEGKVVGVTDGDTFTLRTATESHKIRLVGVDSPERGQDYGAKAKEALSSLVFGKAIRVRWKERDQYDRILGDAIVGSYWVNLELVRSGWAWHYTRYSNDEDLHSAEQTARSKRLGLWADANAPQAPWDYRGHKAQSPLVVTPPPTTNSPSSETDGEESLSHWINSSSGVRHNSSCKYFRNTKRGRLCGPNEGRPCGICGG